MPNANPLELTTEQSKRFLNQLLDFGDPLPHLILTGGDPLGRKDIYELIDYAKGLGWKSPSRPAPRGADQRRDLEATSARHREHGIEPRRFRCREA
jgi:AdoMet-dependent heme synthase